MPFLMLALPVLALAACAQAKPFGNGLAMKHACIHTDPGFPFSDLVRVVQDEFPLRGIASECDRDQPESSRCAADYAALRSRA